MKHWWEIAAPPSSDEPRHKAVAYDRHSGQDRQEGPLPTQQDQFREWAEKNGFEIAKEFADGRPTTRSNRPKAIGYVRTAVAGSEDSARQVRAIREHCERQAIQLVTIAAACGKSGIQPFDARGGRIIKARILCDGVETLIVTDVARLSRSIEDLMETVDWLTEHDVGLYVLCNGAYYCPNF